MKAISLMQPWPWLILHAGKDIENRQWTTSYRGPIALHASRTFDKQATRDGQVWLPERYRPQNGATMPTSPYQYDIGGIVGIAMLTGVVTHSSSRWFSGPYGFLLRDVHAVPFVACNGKPGLFDVPDKLLSGLCDEPGCVQLATVHSPSGKSHYCELHSHCSKCGGSVALFVPYPPEPEQYVCPCLVARHKQLVAEELLQRAEQGRLL